jgi:hypothetical protein
MIALGIIATVLAIATFLCDYAALGKYPLSEWGTSPYGSLLLLVSGIAFVVIGIVAAHKTHIAKAK